jgi:hypothetical protein
VLENGVQRRIFRPKRSEIIVDWRKLNSDDLHNLYSPNIITMINSRMRGTGHVTHTRMGERRNACKVLVGKPEGKRPPVRAKCKWEDNVKMYLRDIG